jgi:putative CocE/NonD family hydrolase
VAIYKAHPSYDRFWHRWDSLAKASDINVPAVHVGGWFDTFALGTVDAYRTRQHQGGAGAKGKQKLVMGPWVHGIGRPVEIAGSHFPDFDVPDAYTQDAWGLSIIGEDTAFNDAANVAYYVMGDVTDHDAPGNEWRSADDWPVPNNPTAFYFHPDGSLSTEKLDPKSSTANHVEYTFDPEDPCPTRGGCNLCIPAGPHKQNDVEGRDDVLTFTTAVLENPVEVTGHPEARIFLASSAVDTDLSIRLCDVYPDGSSYLMAEGMQRVRYRNSISKPELMDPETIYEVKVAVWPTSIVFNKGHRIRVTVTSSNYPRFDRNPGTGEPWDVSSQAVKQTNRLHCAESHCSHVILPIITN